MYYSKLKRYVFLFSFFVLLLSINSCKKDEASSTATTVEEFPALSTDETKALLEGYTWRAIAYRNLPGAEAVNPVANTFLYRFVDTTGVFRIDNSLRDFPYYKEYNLTTPTGVLIIKRNTRPLECRGVYSINGNRLIFENLSGRYIYSGTYYLSFKDSLAYLNDIPSLTSKDKYHYPSADVPMTTFKKQ